MDNILNSAQIAFDEDTVWLLNLSLAVIMFGVALGVKIQDFKFLIKNPKPILVGLLSQLVFLPALTFLIILVIKPQPSIALGMILIAACPGGNISNFMTKLANGNTALSICLTAVTTLLAMFTTPFNFEFWGSLYPPTAQILKTINLDPYQLIKVIGLILGVPLILGMTVNTYYPKFSQKIVKPLKFISIAIFMALVLMAIITNFEVLKKYILIVLLLVVAHNLIAITTGYFTAKGFRLSTQNQRTLAIETGIQNSGLGLLLIFTFFKGLGGMALVAAAWGMWHIISGLSLGFFWSNKPLK